MASLLFWIALRYFPILTKDFPILRRNLKLIFFLLWNLVQFHRIHLYRPWVVTLRVMNIPHIDDWGGFSYWRAGGSYAEIRHKLNWEFGKFSFLRWYVENEVSLDFAEESERFLVWGYKVSLMNLQWEIFLWVHLLSMEQEQEIIFLK